MEAQRKLLEELIALKAEQIFKLECHHFWGSAEACIAKGLEVDEKIRKFREKVKRAFPGVIE